MPFVARDPPIPMDLLCASPSFSPPSSSSYSPLPPHVVSSSSAASGAAVGAAAMARNESISGVRGGRGRGRGRSRVSEVTGRLISGLLTCIFATVGFFVGAVTGAIIGQATESGLFRGAGIGAVSGAVFSIDVVESSLVIWRSGGSGIWSILYVIEIIASLLSGRLVREKVGPAVQNAIQSQMSAVDSPFDEVLDIFETGGTKGMTTASVDKIPRVVVTAENNVDSSGERLCCSVCLQDLQAGETVRSLPHCRHMFHLPCIDSWLLRHGSCPLCRRDF